MNPALRNSAAHVFVDSLAEPELRDADEHHLRRVVRLRAAETITVCDGRGSWAPARLGERIELLAEPANEPEPEPVRVVAAIPKGDRLEWMVEKLVEVGATVIALVGMERSVVRWDEARRSRQHARLGAIARRAAEQSRRLWLPELRLADTLAPWVDLPGAVVADPDGRPLAQVGRPSAVIVGPEGGFADGELPTQVVRVALGAHILRVETAAITAAWVISSPGVLS